MLKRVVLGNTELFFSNKKIRFVFIFIKYDIGENNLRTRTTFYYWVGVIVCWVGVLVLGTVEGWHGAFYGI